MMVHSRLGVALDDTTGPDLGVGPDSARVPMERGVPPWDSGAPRLHFHAASGRCSVPESKWPEYIEVAASAESGEFQPGWPTLEIITEPNGRG